MPFKEKKTAAFSIPLGLFGDLDLNIFLRVRSFLFSCRMDRGEARFGMSELWNRAFETITKLVWRVTVRLFAMYIYFIFYIHKQMAINKNSIDIYSSNSIKKYMKMRVF